MFLFEQATYQSTKTGHKLKIRELWYGKPDRVVFEDLVTKKTYKIPRSEFEGAMEEGRIIRLIV
jgi:hypothetical protein